jgi:hypothetical protein
MGQARFSILTLLWMGPALAAQGFTDEIQVYTQDIQKPGKMGLELHLNRNLQGPKGAPDGLPFNGSTNLTPEFSFGLTRTFELGLYLPSAFDTDHHYRFAGPKLRAKWMPVQPPGEDAPGAFLGLNVELARMNRGFSEARWDSELRLIAGHQGEDWLLAVNPIFGWPMSDGQGRGTPDVTTAWKATYSRWKHAAPGLELYIDHGLLNHPSPLREQNQRLFLTLDVDQAPFVFNVGIGHGLNSASERWTLKFIFEIPF